MCVLLVPIAGLGLFSLGAQPELIVLDIVMSHKDGVPTVALLFEVRRPVFVWPPSSVRADRAAHREVWSSIQLGGSVSRLHRESASSSLRRSICKTGALIAWEMSAASTTTPIGSFRFVVTECVPVASACSPRPRGEMNKRSGYWEVCVREPWTNGCHGREF